MSSDADYAAFLDKANQNTGGNKVSAQSKSKSVGTKAVNTEVPKALEKVDEYFTSDSDEPFEPVSLSWDGKAVPSEDEFADLVGHKGEITKVSNKDFDPQDQYKKVVGLVQKAGSGSVTIFRLELGGTRSEYYVVSLNKGAGKVVGLKAISVES